ncbi:FGGY-family carbohydrate kinase [Micromonospora zamorensis]|uniref:FGGY-family carbohydrate kinase n=1 Tax=Micromonospora zamorensis TaxID=709883 RepID=UPI0033DACDE8
MIGIAAGAQINRVVAVGGGTRGGLWTQIISDVTGLPQGVPSKTIGASFGSAYLAASAVEPVDITEWNPVAERITPESSLYDARYQDYLSLYPATRDIVHRLAT